MITSFACRIENQALLVRVKLSVTKINATSQHPDFCRRMAQAVSARFDSERAADIRLAMMRTLAVTSLSDVWSRAGLAATPHPHPLRPPRPPPRMPRLRTRLRPWPCFEAVDAVPASGAPPPAAAELRP